MNAWRLDECDRNQDPERYAVAVTRYYHIDALRCFCMLYGVFLHTTTLQDFGALMVIPTISDYFRMDAFFLVSAFLSGMLLDRRGMAAFLSHRTRSLLLPFFATLILFNPVTIWLVYIYHGNASGDFVQAVRQTVLQPDETAGPGIWHLHLWFLISLYVYVLLSPAALRLFRSAAGRRALAAVKAALAPALQPAALALAVALAVPLLRGGLELALPGASHYWLVKATVSHLPFFLLGLLLYTDKELWDRCHTLSPVLIPLCAALFVLRGVDVIPAGAGGMLFQLFLRAAITVTAVFALLWLFRRLAPEAHPATGFLTRSIYTVYLVHYFLIYLLAVLLMPLDLPPVALFLTVSLGAIALGLAAHYQLVERSALLKLLFNGRVESRKQPGWAT